MFGLIKNMENFYDKHDKQYDQYTKDKNNLKLLILG